MNLYISSQANIELKFDKGVYTILIDDKGHLSSIQIEEKQLTEIVAWKILVDEKVLAEKHLHLLEKKMDAAKKAELLIRENAQQILSKLSSIKPTAEVEIYISDRHVGLLDSEKITNACGEFMEALGYELETQDEPIYNSFWQKLRFVFSRQVSPEEIDQLFNKGKRALELKHIELPTAEQTEKLANASAKIVEALEKFDEGVVKLGSLLVVKGKFEGEPRIIIRQLTADLMKAFDETPELIKSPKQVYEFIKSKEKPVKVLDNSAGQYVVEVGQEVKGDGV